jgi:hypothetical protein
VVGRRLSLGTWLALEAWARWLSGKTHADRSGLVRLVVMLRRVAASVFAAVFYGSIVQRAYGAVYLLPLVWAVGAWQMSDTSATPPPRGATPESDEDARRRRAKARGALDPNGVMCILHPPAEEEVSKR